MKDYYEILNINRDATEEEIEEAYQKLVKEYKPSAHGNDASLIRYFEQIEEAYLTLSNEDKKYVYDQELMDQSAELVWTLRQLDEKQKRKPFRVKSTSKAWTIVVSVVIIGIVLFLFTILDEPNQITFQSKRNTSQETALDGTNAAATEEGTDFSEDDQAFENEEKDNSFTAIAEEPTQPVSGEDGTNSADTRTTDNSALANLSSLEDYLKVIGSEKHTYDEKAAMIDEALKLFEDRKANVLVIGSNDVQTRRETIQNYLDIVMIQSYKVTVIDTEKNSQGKITQISVKEKL